MIQIFKICVQERREYHNGYIVITIHTLRNPISCSCDCCLFKIVSNDIHSRSGSRSDVSGDDCSVSSGSATGRSDSSGSGTGSDNISSGVESGSSRRATGRSRSNHGFAVHWSGH